MSRYNETERVGVNAVERISLSELRWIFREQPIADMGIDAQLEKVDDRTPTGKLIGLQIKTGESHFKENDRSYVYYGDLVHLDYWTKHSLPVLLIAHLPKSNQTLWIEVNSQTAVRTEKRWKIEIPKDNIFGSICKNQISEIFEGSPYEQKLRKLAIDESLMRHIEDGGKVSVGLEDWVNKSLGRSPVEVFITDDEGNEILSKKWAIVYTGYSITEVAEKLFPWADITIDEQFYEENSDTYDEDNIEYRLSRATDEDNGIIFPNLKNVLYPYSNNSGEVEAYRLELHLNDLSRAYLKVADYLNEE